MICILHGYLLEGSGSNLWTRSVIEALCRQGVAVHLMAQENHPERYPFLREARRYPPGGGVETFYRNPDAGPGCCVLHKPVLGDTLPVYVRDRYEEFRRAVPMVELPDGEIEAYLQRNVAALLRVVDENGITALHANHSVLMSVVAQRVSARTGVPFAIMPHGSGLEFAVKRDARFLRLAEEAFSAASRVFVIGDEIRRRVERLLPGVDGLTSKFVELHLGVDASQFEPIPRERRGVNVAELVRSLEGVPRGRTPAQTEALLAALRPGLDGEELERALDEARGYDGKAPDAAVEEKLATVDWQRDPTLLFVGRLISTKGVQGVVAALPRLLERLPRLRLLLVGHGPLREPLEALLLALRRGDRALAETIVERGRALEGSPEGETEGTELTEVALYWRRLARRGELDAYFDAAHRLLRPDGAIFTGYLAHRELKYLFPCCDAAVFPSVVREAGPLVFLESLASGTFPLGTYFGGMRASIDSLAESLPTPVLDAMKLDPAPRHTVHDIVEKAPAATELAERWRGALHAAVRGRYDWSHVARTLLDELEAM